MNKISLSLVLGLCLLMTDPVVVKSEPGGDPSSQLKRIIELSQNLHAAADDAQNAESVEDLKGHLDSVIESIWGYGSGLSKNDYKGAAHRHGWKTRWQVSYRDFGPKYYKRYSEEPPPITDTNSLGIIGIGRDLRHGLQAVVDDSTRSDEERLAYKSAIATLNNVIGWMKMEVGNIKAEDQPRVDLTRVWNAPKEFWNSTADTGWLQEVYSQALNIQKTDYKGDIAMAKKHLEGLIGLMKKVEEGLDADGDGAVEARMMEGGLSQLTAKAKELGLL